MYTVQDDMEKTITGTLYGSKLFEKDVMMGTWTINAEKALVWENAMLERIEIKKPWQNRSTIDVANPVTGQITNQLIPANNMNFLNKTPVYKHTPSPVQLLLPNGDEIKSALQAEVGPPLNGSDTMLDPDKFLVKDNSQHSANSAEQMNAKKNLKQANGAVKTEDGEALLQNLTGPVMAPNIKKDMNSAAVLSTPSKKPPGASTTIGKRPHREVIEDFEGVYLTYKRQKRTATQKANEK